VFPRAAWLEKACASNASIDGSIARRSCKSPHALQLTTSEVLLVGSTKRVTQSCLQNCSGCKQYKTGNMTDCCKRLQNVNSVTYSMAMRLVYFSNYNLLKVLVFVEGPAMMPAIVCVLL
jgi:hypothetical protein